MNNNDIILRLSNHSPHPNPVYATPGASGMDIHAWLPDGPITLAPMERRLIPTGLYMDIPYGYEVQIRPRSGLSLKQGLTVVNTPGTVDSDYRGEVSVIMINLSEEPVTISDGDRICQMIVAPVIHVIWQDAGDSLSQTDRGDGGFGHTGV